MKDPAILLPLDGSKAALGALPVAQAFARLEDAPLRILHVTPQALPIDQLITRVGLRPSDLKGASVEQRAGDPSAAILQAARALPSRLVVISTHTAPGSPADILGGTAFTVLRGADCPVVLVNPALNLTGWRLRRVLLPHEGTPAISDAIRPGAEVARRAGAELIVLQVAAGAAPPPERGSLTPPTYLDQPQHEWPVWAAEFLERLGCICPLGSIQVRLLLGRGDPAIEILRVAGEQAVDLIVLTWKGEWQNHAATFKAVVDAASCPVMAVRI